MKSLKFIMLFMLAIGFTTTNYARGYSEEQMAEYREEFKTYDSGSDGHISAQELGIRMRKLGQNPTESDIQRMIAKADKDGSGTINFEEFCAWMSQATSPSSVDEEEEIKAGFKVNDLDGDSFITADELFQFYRSIGEQTTLEEAKELIKEVDTNGNGKIDFNEFAKKMKEN